MKTFALLLLVLPVHVFAKGLACMPDTHATRTQISWNEKEVVLRVENPMGYSHMPQMEAVGESSISFLKMQTEDLKKLGDFYEYHWDRSSCKMSDTDEWLISCQGLSHATQKDNDISSLGFTTARLEEQSLSGKQTSFRTRITFDSANIYFVTLPAPMEGCWKF